MKQVCPLYRVQFRNGIILAADRQTDRQTDRLDLSVLSVLNMSNRRGLPDITTGGTRLFASL